jgi:hypothetical protein
MYFSLFIFAFIYEVVIVYDALRLNSMIQVVGVCIFNFLMLIYAAVQPGQVKYSLNQLSDSLVLGVRPILPPELNTWLRVRPMLYAVLSVQALAAAVLSIVAYKLHGEFAWVVYKVINGDISMKRRLLTFQVCLSSCLCIRRRQYF